MSAPGHSRVSVFLADLRALNLLSFFTYRFRLRYIIRHMSSAEKLLKRIKRDKR